MNKIFSLHIIFWLIGIFFLFSPSNSFAAQLSFRVVPNDTIEDGIVNLEVRIDPEDKNLNVVEGSISFGGVVANDLSVEINRENSVFTMWPTEPIFNKEDKMVHFVGGTPNGLTQEGLLFTVLLSSKKEGELDVSWSGVKTYLNDGKGTEEGTSVKSITLNLSKENTENYLNKENNIKTSQKETLPRFNFIKNVTIFLLIIILLSTILYGYKKNITK